MSIAQMFQYSVAMLLVANFAGNRFVNGILFGCSDSMSMVLSGILLTHLPDMKAFRIVFSLGLIAYILLISFSDNAHVGHIAIVFLVLSVGGWNNILQLIIEMRIPPLNIAAVSILTKTLAMGSGVFAATVASFPPTHAYTTLASLSICGLIASFWLPEPGHHLMEIQESSTANTVKLIDKKTN